MNDNSVTNLCNSLKLVVMAFRSFQKVSFRRLKDKNDRDVLFVCDAMIPFLFF